MTLKEKCIFFNWMQKHGALQHYKKNRHLFLIDPSKHSYFTPYVNIHITNAIDAAFTWESTEQGVRYWLNLDNLWNKPKECEQFFPI